MTWVRNLVNKFYTTPPSNWLEELRKKKSSLEVKPEIEVVSIKTSPLARILDAEYFARRDPFINTLIDRICKREELNKVLCCFDARVFDERVAEYSYFVDWLLDKEAGQDLLDVGCVMNNSLVSGVLQDRCKNVWLANVAFEANINVANPVFYHLTTLRDAFPNGEQFPLVTCFSTIEHIGYDNSQYGSKDPGAYTQPALEPLIESFRKLGELTAPGGSLLISVPYGYREAIIHPITRKIASQIFDFEALREGIKVLEKQGFSCNLEVMAASENGWKAVDPITCNAQYADGCPAAGAVAFLKVIKP